MAAHHVRHINYFFNLSKNIASIFKASRLTIAPIIDMLLSSWLFKTFLVSAIIKLSNWDNALYLARYEYPLSWIDPVSGAYLGVAIELICPLFLLIGLGVRFFSLPLLILSVVIQFQYQPLDHNLLWILFCAWYFVIGAGKFSLDGVISAGFSSIPLPFSGVIRKFFKFVTIYGEPLLLFLLRVFIAMALNLASQNPWPIFIWLQELILYQNQYQLISAYQSSFFLTELVPFFLLLGFAFRPILLLLTFLVPFTPEMMQSSDFVYWFLLLAVMFFHGGSILSFDYLLQKKFAQYLLFLKEKTLKKLGVLPHVVIVGGGFGGVSAAKELKDTACKITLIDRNNYHLFQPLLYQVSTATLSPADIATPIREMFRTQENVKVLMQEVVDINSAQNEVITDESKIKYDYLILATGAKHSYFGRDEWLKFAPGLKTIDDAVQIRKKILIAFEKAENTDNASLKESLLSFVIVGGGPTGVELAGAIAELVHHGMKDEFENIDFAQVKIFLVQSADRLLPPFNEDLSKFTKESLEELGVTVLTGSRVDEIDALGVKIGEKTIAASNVFWAAGVEASPAAKWLKVEPATRAGHIETNNNLLVKGFKNIFAIGDVAHAKVWQGQAMPGLAPAAKQSGIYVAKYINNLIEGKAGLKEFKYQHLGNLATIGRKSAVADFAKFKFKGAIAWWFWGFIHVLFLASMRNRISVAVQWFWSYITMKRSTRLITKN